MNIKQYKFVTITQKGQHKGMPLFHITMERISSKIGIIFYSKQLEQFVFRIDSDKILLGCYSLVDIAGFIKTLNTEL